MDSDPDWESGWLGGVSNRSWELLALSSGNAAELSSRKYNKEIVIFIIIMMMNRRVSIVKFSYLKRVFLSDILSLLSLT